MSRRGGTTACNLAKPEAKLCDLFFITTEMSSRKAKEAFVHGFSGSTRAEVAIVVLLVPLLALAHACLRRLLHRNAFAGSVVRPGGWVDSPSTRTLYRFLTEFSALVLPELGVMMSWADPRAALAVSAAVAAASLLLSACYGKPAPLAAGVSVSECRQEELQLTIDGFSGPHKTCASRNHRLQAPSVLSTGSGARATAYPPGVTSSKA